MVTIEELDDELPVFDNNHHNLDSRTISVARTENDETKIA